MPPSVLRKASSAGSPSSVRTRWDAASPQAPVAKSPSGAFPAAALPCNLSLTFEAGTKCPPPRSLVPFRSQSRANRKLVTFSSQSRLKRRLDETAFSSCGPGPSPPRTPNRAFARPHRLTEARLASRSTVPLSALSARPPVYPSRRAPLDRRPRVRAWPHRAP